MKNSLWTIALSRWTRLLARALTLIWAGGWTIFGLLSGIGEGYDGLGILRHATFPGLIFLLAAILAWRWQLVGGILLFLAGVGTLGVYGFTKTPAGLLTLTLPPIIAGVFFLGTALTAKHAER